MRLVRAIPDVFTFWVTTPMPSLAARCTLFIKQTLRWGTRGCPSRRRRPSTVLLLLGSPSSRKSFLDDIFPTEAIVAVGLLLVLGFLSAIRDLIVILEVELGINLLLLEVFLVLAWLPSTKASATCA